ncbi:ribokinase [Paenactinomyces guangxiensis]|uniref:Ribokinase n=1 Tax=Paenactinomyces guangxiensis TaxID=1490290 RepID=A0A7W2AA22_9BACL|nr:ribokinase [Paenactinomyces guangxiensis]MBA4495498.1 ribokinase [Paenactinomyces guangxiensis]MBH8592379.1 ribokinase [Paenactinomyces guangxiensis]
MGAKSKIVVVGSLNMDVVVKAKRPPRMGETILGDEVHFVPGGKGANQAVAAAKLGSEVTMIGSVGQDPFGHSLLRSLQEQGIRSQTVRVLPGVPTGVASIILAQEDNCIIVVSGANSHCQPEHVAEYQEYIKMADVVLLQLEIPLDTVQYAAQLAKELGKTVILNPAPAQNLPDTLLRNVDYITPNQSELELLTGISPEKEGLEAGMNQLLKRGVRHVITTLGREGAAVLSSGEPLVRVAGYRVPVVDTTGAGDAFNAGLACALAEQKRVKAAIDFAGKVAALAVTKLGAQPGMPTRAEVNCTFFERGADAT